MIFDFDNGDCPAPVKADVCVIGAGAAGILLATQLAEAGRRVTLLEGGGLQLEARSQNLYQSKLTGQPYQGIHHGRFRTYGGSTTQWGGQILELDDFDFEKRPHVPGSGWPFPKSQLRQYYDRAVVFEGLRRAEWQDAAVWKKLGLTPFDLGSEFSMAFSRWCPERNFAELYGRTLKESRRISVFLHASAVQLVLNQPRNLIQAVRIRSFSQREALINADAFVVCLGGIETNRLLLQPQDDGVAPWQANGLLGRFYQDHISCGPIPVTNLAPKPASRYFGYVTTDGFKYHNKIRLNQSEQNARRTLNVAGTIGPLVKPNPLREKALQTLRRARRNHREITAPDALMAALQLPALAAERVSLHLRGEEPLWKRTMLCVHCEQSPLSASAVRLSDQVDELGMLRSHLHWEISQDEIHSLRTYVRMAESVFSRQSFARVDLPAGFYEDDSVVVSMCHDSNHHMGGTRISVSPSDGIVDPDLRLHGVANGYVCSSSVFGSSGFSNPTHTVLALGMRLSDRLSQRDRLETAVAPPAVAGPGMGSLREVLLPRTGRTVPQLGFGCAYLLGPGLDAAKSRRLLDACYDAGIRHFDTARSYGHGRTEALVGDFLAKRPEATVATKFGIIPPGYGRRINAFIKRRIPVWQKFSPTANTIRRSRFGAAEARAALEQSLRLLKRDHVQLFLLHEPQVEDLIHDDLWSFLEKQRDAGRIGNFGVGGEFSRISGLLEVRPQYCPLLQFEWSVLGSEYNIPEVYRIHYRTFARPAQILTRHFEQHPAVLKRWSASTGIDLGEPFVLARVLLKAALEVHPASLMLFSTNSERHIFENVAVAADANLVTPALRLVELIHQERATLTGPI